MKWYRWLVVLPALGMLGGVPFANRVRPYVFGLPFLLAWIVMWVILTSAVMALIYKLDSAHDSARDSAHDFRTGQASAERPPSRLPPS